MSSVSTHDVQISTLGGTAMGFMLTRDRKSLLRWQRRHLRGIPSRQMSDTELTYSQFPEQVQRVWVQSSWLYGMGGIDRTDTLKIAEGYKIDGSIRGKLQLARKLALSTVDNNPSQYVPSGFVKSGAQMHAFIGDYPYSWDFTNKNWDRGTQLAGTTGPRMFRNGVEYAGSVYVPSWADDVGSGGSYTGSDEPCVYIYKTTGATSWTQKASSVTHPAFFKFFAIANSKLIAGYVGDAATSTTINDAGGINATEGQVAVSNAAGIVVGDVIQIEDELCLVYEKPGGQLLNIVRGYRGTVGASHVDATAVWEVTLNKHQIRTSTDGTTWSSATNIGDSTSPIVGMLGLDWGTASYVYIFKTDGTYKYDFTNVDKISVIGGPTNGRANCAWNGKVYFSKSGGGLYQIDADNDAITDVSFNLVMPQQTHLHGEVVALTAEADAIYALVLDTTNLKYHLMQGFNVAGNASISWHHVGAIAYTTGTDANHAALYPDSVPNGSAARQRIQVGVESTGSSLLPYHFFRAADQDAVFSPDDDSYIVTIKEDYGLVLVSKRWHKLVVTTDNLGSGANDHYEEFKYRIDGGSWQWFTNSLGGTQSQANSKVTADSATLYFAVGEDGKACEVQVLPFQGTTTTTSPELHDMSVTTQVRVDTTVMFPLALDVRDGLLLKNGVYEYNAAGLMSQLRTWKDQTDAVTFVDVEGTSHTCIFDHDFYEEEVVESTNGYRKAWVVKALLYKLT